MIRLKPKGLDMMKIAIPHDSRLTPLKFIFFFLFLLIIPVEILLAETVAAIPNQQIALDNDSDSRAILVGDFDNDGRADIFRADWNHNGRQYNVLMLNKEEGWKRVHGPLAKLLGGDDRQLYVGDFDGDGRSDLLRADQSNDGSKFNTWFSLDENEVWHWHSGPAVSLWGEDRRIYIGDFDGNKTSDILLGFNDSTSENRIFYLNEDKTWTVSNPGLNYKLGGYKREILIADFDGNGRDDILRADGANNGRKYNRLALSQLDGSWQVYSGTEANQGSPSIKLVSEKRALYLGNFDGDKGIDILRADWNDYGSGDKTQFNAILTYESNGEWSYEANIPYDLDLTNRSIHIGDFNGDTRDDILLADWNGNGYEGNKILLSQEGGGWSLWAQPNWKLGGGSREVFLGYFDSDNQADIFRADWTSALINYNRIDHPGTDKETDKSLQLLLGGREGVGFPEIPALFLHSSDSSESSKNLRKITGFEDGAFVKPHIPPLRTSNDGRIAVYLKPFNANEPDRRRKFTLIRPESLDAHFDKQNPGINILSGAFRKTIFEEGSGVNGHHLTLCDASSQLPESDTNELSRNPKACGVDNNDDCYDLTAITTTLDSAYGKFWSRKIEVQVRNPKSKDAEIVNITLDGSIESQSVAWTSGSGALEPMITRDGRLFVFRVSGSQLNNADDSSKSYNIVYAYIPEKSESGEGISACDITQLKGPFPISQAYLDSDINEKYGFAKYQFRDPEGNFINAGEDLKGSYPWIDREGRNIFMTAISSTLYYKERGDPEDEYKTRYLARCVGGNVSTESCELNPTKDQLVEHIESLDRTRGIIAMGLWTRGKMIALDGDFANTDFGLHQKKSAHRELRLFEPHTAEDNTNDTTQTGWIRVGTGRDKSYGELPSLAVSNTTFIDSLENLFNYGSDSALFPATPRDVVWTLNTGRASADVAFDDFLQLNTVINLNMNASMTHEDNDYRSDGSTKMRYNDGFDDTDDFEGSGFSRPVHFQNASTAIPSFVSQNSELCPDSSECDFGLGYGNIRVEPTAIGGIIGKGLWLDGFSGVKFELFSHSGDENKYIEDPYVSLFMDQRAYNSTPQRILLFPDGSELLVGRNIIQYISSQLKQSIDDFESLNIPEATPPPIPEVIIPTILTAKKNSWTHLGLKFQGEGDLQIWIDGYLLATLPIDQNNRPLSSGTLYLGAPYLGEEEFGNSLGFRGWVDEFKIFGSRSESNAEYVLNPEVACNQALGTLLQLDENDVEKWSDIAEAYGSIESNGTSGHEIILDQLGMEESSSGRFVCFHDYERDRGILSKERPNGTSSIRTKILMANKNLVFGKERPDSTSNRFCLECHDLSQPKKLSVIALEKRSGIYMEDDLRRQPMQAPRLMSGNIPAKLFVNGLPIEKVSSNNGEKIDQWLAPSPP